VFSRLGVNEKNLADKTVRGSVEGGGSSGRRSAESEEGEGQLKSKSDRRGREIFGRKHPDWTDRGKEKIRGGDGNP